MPVRSLNSSVLIWPNAREWAARQARLHPELVGLGYFGSYARGDWGVGSDLDLVAIVSTASTPFGEQALEWRMEDLPVPAENLIYTQDEWHRLLGADNPFLRRLATETIWLLARQDAPACA